jgi:mRNA-degrading endonuclease RelE of RelBE toxin-antitoxin system
MTPLFTVQTVLLKKLHKQHQELTELVVEAIEILETDPYNRSQRYAIKKLRGVQAEGQYRLRLGRWRFRYDILGQKVELKYVGLRREDTYKS